MSNSLSTDLSTFVAEKKLPDDLTILEYSELVSSVEWLCYAAGLAARVPDPQLTIARARYGSDFTLVILVPTAILSTLTAISLVVGRMSRSGRDVAEGWKLQAEADESVARAEKERADARRLNAEAQILELDAHARREEVRRRVSDQELLGEVLGEVLAEDELAGRPINRLLRDERQRALFDDSEELREEAGPGGLGRSIVILASYEISLRTEK
ncbi:hypothetical protein [Microbacterium rhizomatis]|uniref:hypothetical protein n=1 Tax=Microbacterium rhizomatis TaxID=1631477 RepID=UPI001B869864|nr:hypothetical protein [Microbacterium rhizomatis]